MTCEMKNNAVCKRPRKPKWQSRIDKLEAFGTRHKQNKTKTKQKKKIKKKNKAKNKTKTKLKNSTEHKRKDSKGATRTPKKNRQYNGQMNKDN